MRHDNHRWRLRIRQVLVTIVIVGLSVGSFAQSDTDTSVQYLAWELGSRLSWAALGYAEGASAAVVDELISDVTPAAEFFGAQIPPLPERSSQSAENVGRVIYYLLETAVEPIATRIEQAFPGEPAFLFEIAVKSNILLALYEPGGDISTVLVDVIRDRAPSAGLPEELWRSVVDLVEAGAPFEDVKAAVVAMHDDISQFLAPE